jgi:hypothetical protein
MPPFLSKGRADRRLTSVFRICLLLLIGCITLLSLGPPVSRDALVHHLNIPKLYLQYGKIVEFPSMSFSYFPMNLDLLYMIPLGFGNDIAPKFIHFAFALFTAWLIHGYLTPRVGKNYARIGVLLFLSTPIIVKLSITVYVDLGLIFFSTAALLLLFRWVETGFGFKFLTGSAVCCGLAMGTKYNGLIVGFLLTAFVPLFYSARRRNLRHHFVKSIGLGVLYLSVALVVFSPWMIRNWHWKGNPVYPLYNSVFNPPGTVAVNKAQAKRPKAAKGVFTYRSILYQETEWQILLLPVRIFFEGEDGNGRYFDGKLNPFLLIFTVLAFVGMRGSSRDQALTDKALSDQDRWLASQKKILLVFSVLYFLVALFSTVLRIRYISPIIPPLVMLSVFGMKNGMDIFQKKLRGEHGYMATFAGGAILIACFGLNGHYLWTQFRVVDPLGYLTGSVSRDEYITRYRPEYPVMQYANQNLSSDARILFVFMGKRGYYCDRAYLLDSAGKPSLLMKIVNRSETPEEIASTLRESGITHMMLQFDIFNRWVNEDVPGEKRGLFKAFLRRYTKLIYSHHLYGLAALASPEEPGGPGPGGG